MQSVTDKETFRRALKDLSVPEKERKEIDNVIRERFFSGDALKHKTVFVYVAFGDEVETAGIIERYLELSAEVYVPLCHGKGEMEAKRIFSRSDLKPGRYNIPEPPSDAETCDPRRLSLIVVPGLAFGEDLSRLGRGAGYYDRFMKTAENAEKIALCREANVFRTVPHEAHDVFVDMIVTEKRIIKEKRGR